LCWSVRTEGIVGAAIVWTGRVFIDMVALFILSQRLLPSGATVVRRVTVAAAMGLIFVGLGASISSVPNKLLFLLGALSCLALATWYFILTSCERECLQNRIRPTPTSSYAD
jgi:hypothetical protein